MCHFPTALLLAVSPFETLDDLNVVTTGARDGERQCYCKAAERKESNDAELHVEICMENLGWFLVDGVPCSRQSGTFIALQEFWMVKKQFKAEPLTEFDGQRHVEKLVGDSRSAT